MIEKDKSYRIKGESEYFKKKYGTCNPIIEIEDKDTESKRIVLSGWQSLSTKQSWKKSNGNRYG